MIVCQANVIICDEVMMMKAYVCESVCNVWTKSCLFLQKLLIMNRQCHAIEPNLEKVKLPFAMKQIISISNHVILILIGDFYQIPVHVISLTYVIIKTYGYLL